MTTLLRLAAHTILVAAIGFALAGLAGCEQADRSALAEGARLMADPMLSPSQFNDWSCGTCHDVAARAMPSNGSVYPGYTLFNAVKRPSFWGGEVLDLLDAINVCLVDFMRGQALAPDDPRALELLDYLQALSSDDDLPGYAELAGPQPFTLVRVVDQPPAPGDAEAGADLYKRACRPCHGDFGTGEGRTNPRNSVLPDEVLKTADLLAMQMNRAPLTPDERDYLAAQITTEKIRHGRYFGIGGNMPLYTTEIISDEQIGDLLAYMKFQYTLPTE